MKTIVVASGKGGVGKTTLTANLGAALAMKGMRVVLFDADLGLANLDVVTGVKPDMTVHHLVEGLATAEQVAAKGPAGLRIIAGCSGVGSLLRLSRKRLQATLEKTRQLAQSTDILMLDVSSGADARVITFLAFADEVVLVTTPDPTSIVDCYSTAKVLYRRRKDAKVSVVINRVKNAFEGERVFKVLNSAMLRFQKREAGFLGYVREDRPAADMSRSSRLFVLENNALPASNDLAAVAEMIGRMSLNTHRADTGEDEYGMAA